jgi:hypothetical protein
MQEESLTSTELLDSIIGDAHNPIAEYEGQRCAISRLADELIERCCGSHSLGLVYRFLRNAGFKESEARTEFELFLAGTPSERFRATASLFCADAA